MVYEKVNEICKERGISLATVEKEAGLSNGAICKWKYSSPKVSSVQAVAKVLKVKISKLIE